MITEDNYQKIFFSGDLVYFDNVVNGKEGCYVGEAEKMFIDGKLHDLWTFSVGYDDLWDVDPLGNEVVKVMVYYLC